MKVYTGIGSRKTPSEILALMEAYGRHLATNGWLLRSGGADGADLAFQRGVLAGPKEIFLPWDGFNTHVHDPQKGFYVAETFGNYAQAQEIAQHNHPAWKNCGQGARRLHTRNVYQVLGKDLNTPSHALICWAEPSSDGHVKGGTGMAVRIAKQCDVPVINLFHQHNQNRIIDILNQESTQ